MKAVSVAIGKKYEIEAERLKDSIKNVEIITDKHPLYKRINDDDLINALYCKSNFINYIEKFEDSVLFCDADLFSLIDNPLKDFSVNKTTEIAYVPYPGRWFLPDKIRQEAFDYHGHKINSGFIYFSSYEIAKKVCDQWAYEYLEREKLYDVIKGTSKYEYDEWALMIALQKLKLKVELLDKKWNIWELKDEKEILNSNGIFFQSHKHLNIRNLIINY